MISPKISIIVPIYKVPEKYLRQCVESCLNQTFKDVEIILVDDGSPDDCGKICDEYAEKDKRIKIIHKKNGGLVSARNAGYEIVTGEWHMYLDGDDWIDANTCEKLIGYVQRKSDVDVVFWNHILELGDKSIKGKMEWKCEDQIHMYEENESIILAQNTLIYKSGIATAYCKLIRTSFAKEFGLRHDNRLRQGLEGVEFSLRVFYNARKALYIKEYFNHYRYNPDSISKRIDEKNTQYGLDCLTVMLEDVSNFVNKDAFLMALYQRTIYALIAFAMNTYFHPDNPDSIIKASLKYAKVIRGNEICREAIKQTSFMDLDKQRRVVLFFLKFKLYPLIKPVAIMKKWMLSRGYYNY